MTFVAVYDANVLYPSTLRDVLIRIALGGLVQAKWTEEILDEAFRNIEKNRPDLDPRKLERTRQLLRTVVRDCMVTGYEDLIPVVTLEQDPNDRHVVAAAIKSGAQVIVTFNVKDFPADELAKWSIEAKHPDTSSSTSSTSTVPQSTGPFKRSQTPGLIRPVRHRMCSTASNEMASHRSQPYCADSRVRERLRICVGLHLGEA